jgi:hypothetical protein
VGCVLALGGLVLYFTGVIHLYWGLIVAGLYFGGVIMSPRGETLAQTAASTELSADQLAEQLRWLVDSVAKGLPVESHDCLRNIQSTLTELLPRLKQLQDRGIISSKDSFTVVETVRRYLPDTLAAYLRLPRRYAHMQPLADGRTASVTLLHQLRLLDASLKDIARDAFTGDAEKLVINGQFLQGKFSDKLDFRA